MSRFFKPTDRNEKADKVKNSCATSSLHVLLMYVIVVVVVVVVVVVAVVVVVVAAYELCCS